MVTLNLNELNQIESGASKKKIYRFKNKNTKNILVDFSYSFSDYLSFINVHQYLSNKIYLFQKYLTLMIMKNLFLWKILGMIDMIK